LFANNLLGKEHNKLIEWCVSFPKSQYSLRENVYDNAKCGVEKEKVKFNKKSVSEAEWMNCVPFLSLPFVRVLFCLECSNSGASLLLLLSPADEEEQTTKASKSFNKTWTWKPFKFEKTIKSLKERIRKKTKTKKKVNW
jgi:hypothetical protein